MKCGEDTLYDVIEEFLNQPNFTEELSFKAIYSI